MADDINTLFEQLLEHQWKGVPFPTSTFTLTLRHDLAQHKYGDRDGAEIESTGRAPLQFDATIPFLNGAVPGKGETWGVPYPDQYRKFMLVASKGARGILQHPEFRDVPCQLEVCRTIWSAERRDGVMVECTWLETLIPNDDDFSFSQQPSPVAEVLLGAADLDAQISQVTPPFPTLPQYQPDFAAAMRSITGISDQLNLLSAHVAGRIGSVQYRLNTLQASIDNVVPAAATNVKQVIAPDKTLAARACLAWPMRSTLEQIRSTLGDLARVIGTTGRPLKLYSVPRETTLAALSLDVQNSITDLIKLNPKVCASPIILPQTTIRAYAA